MFLVVLSALMAGYLLKVPDSSTVRFLLVALFAYMTFVTSLGDKFEELYSGAGKTLDSFMGITADSYCNAADCLDIGDLILC